MKLSTTILTTTLLLSCSAIIAQDSPSQPNINRQPQKPLPAQSDSNQTAQQNQAQQQNEAAQQDQSINSEPAGAEPAFKPQGRPFGTNPPPGRAFSTNNPPQGRPFEDGGQPGRAFEQEQQVEEPAGAEQPGATNEQPDLNEPAGAQPEDGRDAAQLEAEASQETDAQSGIEGEAAGAQRGGSEQIATALGTLRAGATTGASGQNVQLRQAIKTSIQGRNVPDEFVDRLSQDLSMAFKGGVIKESVRTELAQSLHTVLTAQPTAQAEVEQALTRVQTILIDNGVARPAARSVACDLHLIATEMHPDLHISVPTPR